MIRVLIVDDHVIVRSGLEQLFAAVADIDVVGAVADGAAAIDAVDRLRPDVVLMDLSMPIMDGVEATRRVTKLAPASRVLVLTSFSEHLRVIDALDAGAEGYLLKHSEPAQIVAAIREVHAGGSPLDPKAARVLLESRRASDPGYGLTPREVEVLVFLRGGLSNKQIARELHLSERTVKAHLTRIFQRLGVAHRTDAALWAAEHLDDHSANDGSV